MVESRFAKASYPEGSVHKDGIYYSKWLAEPIPEDPYLTTHTLDHPYMDRVALVDAYTSDSMTYRELKQKVCCGFWLGRNRSKAGGCGDDSSLNGMPFPMLLLAIAAIGAVVTASNPANLSSKIAKQVKDSRSNFVISLPEFVERIVDLKLPLILIDTLVNHNDLVKVKDIVVKMDREPLAYLSELYKADPSRAPKVTIRQTDIAFLLYSSETAGLNKGVKISQRNVIAASVISNDPNYRPDWQYIFLAAVPLYHVYGMI